MSETDHVKVLAAILFTFAHILKGDDPVVRSGGTAAYRGKRDADELMAMLEEAK